MTKRAPNTMPSRLAWQEKGSCTGLSSNAFFVPDRSAAKAKAICSWCPVQQQCLDYAMTTEGAGRSSDRFGVFGGLTGTERAALAGVRSDVPALRTPQSLFKEHARPLPDGHTKWTGTDPIGCQGKTYTSKQLAWLAVYGYRAQGVITTECGHRGCITAEHLIDAVGRDKAHGSARGYKRHTDRGEEPCRKCRDGKAADQQKYRRRTKAAA